MAGEYVVDGLRYLLPQVLGRIHQIKVVCNERGAIFFPVTVQHADRSVEGIVYKESSKGNALAGMVYSDHIELRRHDSFSATSVRAVMARLFTALSVGMDHAAIERLGAYDLVYGGVGLGKMGPQQKPTQQVDSRPGPHRSK
jgi:hypothetical protein